MIENLIPNDGDHLKGGERCDRVDQHITVDADEVLRVQDTVLILASRIDDLGSIVLTLDPNYLAESVFDGRIVAFDKVAVNILDGERGFA